MAKMAKTTTPAPPSMDDKISAATPPKESKAKTGEDTAKVIYVKTAHPYKMYCPPQKKYIGPIDPTQVIVDSWISAQLKAGTLVEV